MITPPGIPVVRIVERTDIAVIKTIDIGRGGNIIVIHNRGTSLILAFGIIFCILIDVTLLSGLGRRSVFLRESVPLIIAQTRKIRNLGRTGIDFRNRITIGRGRIHNRLTYNRCRGSLTRSKRSGFKSRCIVSVVGIYRGGQIGRRTSAREDNREYRDE